MSGYRWDAEEYSKASGQQYKWAQELIAKLNLNGDERVLDIGCGDGKITADIAGLLPHGSVIGIDESPEMVEFACKRFPPTDVPNLRCLVMDASEMPFDNEFDLVFSNATLHWIFDQRPVIAGIMRCLKPGGRALLQMGGQGNAREISIAVKSMLVQEEWRGYFLGFNRAYSFYGSEEYKGWLEEAGFVPLRVELVPKDMVQPGREGLAAWVRTTWLPFTQRLPTDERERFIGEIVDKYIENHPPDSQGLVHMEMVRLEVEALKPG